MSAGKKLIKLKGDSEMDNNKQLRKRMVTLSSLLAMSALFLTSCSGTLSLSGSGNSLGSGSQGSGLNQTTIILIVVGAAVLILILIILASRGKSK
jgi:hypothetical protein